MGKGKIKNSEAKNEIIDIKVFDYMPGDLECKTCHKSYDISGFTTSYLVKYVKKLRNWRKNPKAPRPKIECINCFDLNSAKYYTCNICKRRKCLKDFPETKKNQYDKLPCTNCEKRKSRKANKYLHYKTPNPESSTSSGPFNGDISNQQPDLTQKDPLLNSTHSEIENLSINGEKININECEELSELDRSVSEISSISSPFSSESIDQQSDPIRDNLKSDSNQPCIYNTPSTFNRAGSFQRRRQKMKQEQEKKQEKIFQNLKSSISPSSFNGDISNHQPELIKGDLLLNSAHSVLESLPINKEKIDINECEEELSELERSVSDITSISSPLSSDSELVNQQADSANDSSISYSDQSCIYGTPSAYNNAYVVQPREQEKEQEKIFPNLKSSISSSLFDGDISSQQPYLMQNDLLLNSTHSELESLSINEEKIDINECEEELSELERSVSDITSISSPLSSDSVSQKSYSTHDSLVSYSNQHCIFNTPSTYNSTDVFQPQEQEKAHEQEHGQEKEKIFSQPVKDHNIPEFNTNIYSLLQLVGRKNPPISKNHFSYLDVLEDYETRSSSDMDMEEDPPFINTKIQQPDFPYNQHLIHNLPYTYTNIEVHACQIFNSIRDNSSNQQICTNLEASPANFRKQMENTSNRNYIQQSCTDLKINSATSSKQIEAITHDIPYSCLNIEEYPGQIVNATQDISNSKQKCCNLEADLEASLTTSSNKIEDASINNSIQQSCAKIEANPGTSSSQMEVTSIDNGIIQNCADIEVNHTTSSNQMDAVNFSNDIKLSNAICNNNLEIEEIPTSFGDYNSSTKPSLTHSYDSNQVMEDVDISELVNSSQMELTDKDEDDKASAQLSRKTQVLSKDNNPLLIPSLGTQLDNGLRPLITSDDSRNKCFSLCQVFEKPHRSLNIPSSPNIEKSPKRSHQEKFESQEQATKKRYVASTSTLDSALDIPSKLITTKNPIKLGHKKISN